MSYGKLEGKLEHSFKNLASYNSLKKDHPAEYKLHNLEIFSFSRNQCIVIITSHYYYFYFYWYQYL